MGLLNFLKGSDINAEITNRNAEDILVDVRESDEYRSGHIPGAVNYPLSSLDKANLPWNKDTVLLVYCLSGARSSRAVSYLKRAGYANAKNIGGINSYRGEIEK